MRIVFNRVLIVLLLISVVFAQAAEPPTSGIQWRRVGKTFDANLTDQPIAFVLEQIRKQTGWEVFVDPDLALKVSSEFKGKSPGDALKLVLGNTPYTLSPSIKGATKLYVFRDKRDQATKRIVTKPKEAKPIPNEVVVILKEGKDGKALAAQYNAKIVGFIADLNAYRLKFKDAEAAKQAKALIDANGNWGETDSNYSVDRPEAIEPVGSSALPGLKLDPSNLNNGDAIIIGMIDTGIQLDGMVNTDFLLPSINIVGEPKMDPNLPSHGTSMADTMLRGLAESNLGADSRPVQILPIDVYGDSPTTTTFDIARGITAGVNAGAPIINLSLGGSGDSALLHSVIKNSHDAGVLFLGAAGNEPVATPTYPAAYPEVMAVTASNRSGGIASYANYGDFVDVAAPGANLVRYNGKSWYVSGTSASSAYISGLAAGMTSRSGKTPTQVGNGIISVMGLGNK